MKLELNIQIKKTLKCFFKKDFNNSDIEMQMDGLHTAV